MLERRPGAARGSANWSTAGLKRQDNDARFTTNRQEVQEFNQNFEQLWNRPTNTRVQSHHAPQGGEHETCERRDIGGLPICLLLRDVIAGTERQRRERLLR